MKNYVICRKINATGGYHIKQIKSVSDKYHIVSHLWIPDFYIDT